MAIVQTMCTSFKAEVAQGLHNFTRTTGNVFKLALYVATANIDQNTTTYTPTGEASGTGYSPGGLALTNITPLSSGVTGYWSFDDLTFSNVTLTCAGALIYNNSKANSAVASLSFGGDKTSTSGTFTVIFPTADATSAIIRIA